MSANKSYLLRLEQFGQGVRFLSVGCPFILSVTNSSGINWQVAQGSKHIIIKATWSDDNGVTVEEFKPMPLMKLVGRRIRSREGSTASSETVRHVSAFNSSQRNQQLKLRLTGDILELYILVERPEKYICRIIILPIHDSSHVHFRTKDRGSGKYNEPKQRKLVRK